MHPDHYVRPMAILKKCYTPIPGQVVTYGACTGVLATTTYETHDAEKAIIWQWILHCFRTKAFDTVNHTALAGEYKVFCSAWIPSQLLEPTLHFELINSQASWNAIKTQVIFTGRGGGGVPWVLPHNSPKLNTTTLALLSTPSATRINFGSDYLRGPDKFLGEDTCTLRPLEQSATHTS